MYGFLDFLLDFSAAAMSPNPKVVSSNQQKPSLRHLSARWADGRSVYREVPKS
jgi:hypothetical protein